ncbi:MAG: PQQ-binding-like beta-propeller repeat protein [Planctomycetota bacterium]
MDLKTGKILWQRWIDSDVMSAPVVSGKTVHVASFGGTLYKFDMESGKILSAESQRATSAPVIVGDQLVYSARTDKAGEDASEGIALQKDGTKKIANSKRALNLDRRVQQLSKFAQKGQQWDAGNGFGGGAPMAANPMAALENVGQANVSTLQAYQGARMVASSQYAWGCPSGDRVACTDLLTGETKWEIKLEGDLATEGGSLAAPPAAAGESLFLCTLQGNVLEVHAKTGKLIKKYATGSVTRFQPVVENGRLYVTSEDGKLVVFSTSDPKATGWSQWGGNAARTGVIDLE